MSYSSYQFRILLGVLLLLCAYLWIPFDVSNQLAVIFYVLWMSSTVFFVAGNWRKLVEVKKHVQRNEEIQRRKEWLEKEKPARYRRRAI